MHFARCEEMDYHFENDALNAATGEFKLHARLDYAAYIPALVTGCVFVGAMLGMVSLLQAQQSKVFAFGSDARQLAAQFLVYASVALSGVSPSTPLIKPAVKNSKTRLNFSLEGPSMRLDPCHLSVALRQARCSTILDNTLMPATLDLTPKLTPRVLHTAHAEPSGRHPGRKPDVKKLRTLDLLAVYQDDTVSLDEWEDSDWEDEPRAPPTRHGEEMDGEDVGVLPHRKLQLPISMAHYTRPGVNGRSIFQSDWQIPRANEK